jgi:hypothetical protein
VSTSLISTENSGLDSWLEPERDLQKIESGKNTLTTIDVNHKQALLQTGVQIIKEKCIFLFLKKIFVENILAL